MAMDNPLSPLPESQWKIAEWVQRSGAADFFTAAIKETAEQMAAAEAKKKSKKKRRPKAVTPLQLSFDTSILDKLTRFLAQGADDLQRQVASCEENVSGELLFQALEQGLGETADSDILGPPATSVLDAMFLEHCDFPDSEKLWKSKKYGITTNTRMEFAYVVFPEGGRREALRRIARWVQMPGDLRVKELEAGVADLRDVQQIKLAEGEPKLNYRQFRELCDYEYKEFEREYDKAPCAECKSWPAETSIADRHNCRRVRRLGALRNEFEGVNRLLAGMGETRMVLEELIAVRLFTGPLREVYLPRLGYDPFSTKRETTPVVDDRYQMTVLMLRSAIVKLTKSRMEAMPGSRPPRS